MLPEISAEFCITGRDLLPTEITQGVGLVPTSTWLEGESIQGTSLRRKQNGWCFSLAGPQRAIDLERPILDLLKVLLPLANRIREVCRDRDLECEFSCVASINDETPAVNFRPETIAGLTMLNAALDIDIYVTGGD